MDRGLDRLPTACWCQLLAPPRDEEIQGVAARLALVVMPVVSTEAARFCQRMSRAPVQARRPNAESASQDGLRRLHSLGRDRGCRARTRAADRSDGRLPWPQARKPRRGCSAYRPAPAPPPRAPGSSPASCNAACGLKTARLQVAGTACRRWPFEERLKKAVGGMVGAFRQPTAAQPAGSCVVFDAESSASMDSRPP